ncbi:MAG: hypothetical protein SFT93_01700 [Rickettsiaceae bacterium]|nr:hypothetical protein [Rickettsiaceae bacterium]
MSKPQSDNQTKPIETIRKARDIQQTSDSPSLNSSQILSDDAHKLIEEVIPNPIIN